LPEQDAAVRMKLKDAMRIRNKEHQARLKTKTPYQKDERIVQTEIITDLSPGDELLEFMNTPPKQKKGRWTKHKCPKCGRRFKQFSFRDLPEEKLCRTCNPITV